MSLTFAALAYPLNAVQSSHGEPARSVTGDAAKLGRRFAHWRKEQGPMERVAFALGWSKARSARSCGAQGRAVLDRRASVLEVRLSGLGQRSKVDLWLVPYPEGDPGAAPIAAVPLAGGAGFAAVPLDEFSELELEALAVVESGASLGSGELLRGAPGLFERIATRRGSAARGLPMGPDVPGGAAPGSVPDLGSLVDLGEQVFFQETFAGNGRTCGTCHPAENDFTIDPEFIAALPNDDPLFVAEYLPALDASQNGGLVFENPALMREFGLIVENLDGFDDPANRFVLRGVQHLLGLARTIEPAANLDQPFTHLLGWSGDGSSGGGSLREFADGAVKQHFTRTMGRVAGVDFRLPTPTELNALEAFMLSLGREEDADLDVPLSDGGAEHGRLVFLNTAFCVGCHQGAGSNGFFPGGIGVGDFLQNSGVEALTQMRPDGTGEPRPVDGGFGTNPEGDFESLAENSDGGFGELTFNSQSIVEAASTMPAFHSNLTANANTGLEPTIEGAVRFYTTDAFSEGAGFPVQMSEQEILDVARFLRVLSALDDLDTIENYIERALERFATPAAGASAKRMLSLAGVECRDAAGVLAPVGLHPEVLEVLRASARVLDAAAEGSAPIPAATDRVLAWVAAARASMLGQ